MTKTLAATAAALILGGCASTVQLTLMPRDSGTLYHGVAEGTSGAEGPIRITIGNRTFTGTWVEMVSDRSTAHVFGGWGGRSGYWGPGGTVWMDNPGGGVAKALLTAPDGAGLRCDLRGGFGRAGGGVCRDDQGLEYDVQIRPAPGP